jgi:hypothetical protein
MCKLGELEVPMATNLAIDDELLERALDLDGLVAVVCVALDGPLFRDFERTDLVSRRVVAPVERATAFAMDAHLLQHPSLVRYLRQHNRRRSPA